MSGSNSSVITGCCCCVGKSGCGSSRPHCGHSSQRFLILRPQKGHSFKKLDAADCGRKDFEICLPVAVKDIPVPGIPSVALLPRLPIVTLAPRGPILALIPFLPRFKLIPGAILIDFLNLNPILIITFDGVIG